MTSDDVTSNEVLNSLAAKIDSLDLTAEEQEALDLLISRAATAEGDSDDVVGFGWDQGVAALSPMGLKLGAGLGRIDMPDIAKPEFQAPIIGETRPRL